MSKSSFALLSAASLLVLVGCASTGGGTPAQQNALVQNSESAIARFKRRDPGLQRFFDESVGYVVFPSVGKAAWGVGAAYGEGCLYEGGTAVGHATLNQVTVGFQAGAQEYREVIFFKSPAALADFKRGRTKIGAQASAVAVTAGASTDADYSRGVAIFTMTKGGLMYEASVGGQTFTYAPFRAAGPVGG